MPLETQFGACTRQDSENEDLRGVIDDLTIENRKLKHMLKERNRAQENQSQDKLFDLRVHGLPSDKKRELETLLRSFASSLTVGTEATSALLGASGLGKNSMTRTAKHSSNIHTDSGYASMSGHTSAATSHPDGRSTAPISKRSSDKTVKSYLLPNHSPVMSERAKMSLVVRKLENLFTGKRAAPGEHSQPLQQQEVSRQAATADQQQRSQNNKFQKHEGTREAHILPHDADVGLDLQKLLGSGESTGKVSGTLTKSVTSDSSTPGGTKSSSSGGASPDQRPTRPLDLDVHRAQNAEENVDYIRHLGLSSPKLNTGHASDDEGWVYLNLLVSMAQLHTTNVTPAFIRKSIKRLSAKFELSKDGNQVRWKGGKDATLLNAETMANEEIIVDTILPSDVDLDQAKGTSSMAQASAIPSEGKSSNIQTSDSSRAQKQDSDTSGIPVSMLSSLSKPATSFDYKPIHFTGKSQALRPFLHREDSSAVQSTFDSDSMAESSEAAPDAGPIVFYNTPLFCSDLSGDKSPTNMIRASAEISSSALGIKRRHVLYSETREDDACYFRDASLPAIKEGPVQSFNLSLEPVIESGVPDPEPFALQASGVGGVTPHDNFLLDVKAQRCPSSTPAVRRYGGRRSRLSNGYRYTISSCSQIDLPASVLPLPSYIFLPISSSSSDVDDSFSTSDEGSDLELDEHVPALPAFLTHFSTGSSDRVNSGEATEDDSESIEMLATARAGNPGAVAGQERLYESVNKPPPTQGGLTTGSLIATIGNGSDDGCVSIVDEAGSYMEVDDDDESDGEEL